MEKTLVIYHSYILYFLVLNTQTLLVADLHIGQLAQQHCQHMPSFTSFTRSQLNLLQHNDYVHLIALDFSKA